MSRCQNILDSAVLVMPLVFFCDAAEPRFVVRACRIVRNSDIIYRFKSTLNAILRSPERGGLLANNLVFRYNTELVDDGVGGEEGGAFQLSTYAFCVTSLTLQQFVCGILAFSLCTLWAVEA